MLLGSLSNDDGWWFVDDIFENDKDEFFVCNVGFVVVVKFGFLEGE